MLATLFIIPQTPEEFSIWSFTHAAHHRDINRVIFQRGGGRLDEYVLDPFNPQDMGNWPYLHQTMHDQMNAALGLAGYDLTEIDWEDRDRTVDWVIHNGNLHYQAGAILGLG